MPIAVTILMGFANEGNFSTQGKEFRKYSAMEEKKKKAQTVWVFN